jgi:hypothetical protein
MSLAEYRQRVNELLLERQRALADADRECKALQQIQTNLEAANESQVIFQSVAQSIQQRVHERMAGIVTRCLNAVFEDPYQFSIRFDRKRGKTEARMVFSRDGVELEDPLNEIGGGVVDVAALALRLGCVLMHRPPLRRFLCLDEPFRYVRGQDNRARTKTMLERLVKDLDLQILLNTDVTEFRFGKVVELGD